ncbi:hypothetical protein ACFVAJ_17740 [Agromyces sp. NPDC057679]|uniref:hypothetical protein n=1 Tax=Agromyces sp. NPDC057679 TaxID=3346207 RepID=UPI00366EC3C8
MSAPTITRPDTRAATGSNVGEILSMFRDHRDSDGDTPAHTAAAGIRLWLLGANFRLTVFAAHGLTAAAEALQKHALNLQDRHLNLTAVAAQAQIAAAPVRAALEPAVTEPIAVREDAPGDDRELAEQAAEIEAGQLDFEEAVAVGEIVFDDPNVSTEQELEREAVASAHRGTGDLNAVRQGAAPNPAPQQNPPARRPARIREFLELESLPHHSVIVLWSDRGWNLDLDVYLREHTGWTRWIGGSVADVPHTDRSIWSIASSTPKKITRVHSSDQPAPTLGATHLDQYAHQSLIVGVKDGNLTNVFQKVSDQWVDLTPGSGATGRYDGADLHGWFAAAGGELVHGWQPVVNRSAAS